MNTIDRQLDPVLQRLEEPLSQEPSKAAWRQITGVLLHLHLEEIGESQLDWLPEVSATLERWPDELRFMTPALKRRVAQPPYPAWLSLVRVFDLIGFYSEWRDAFSFETFLTQGNICQLHTFHCRYRTFGDEGIKLLADRTNGVVDLLLGNCQIGDDGANLMADSNAFKNLQKLSLHSNHIGDEALLNLLHPASFPNLEILNIFDNKMSHDAAAKIKRIAQESGCKLTMGRRYYR